MNGGECMDKDPFKEYIRQAEPSKRDKGYAWHTASGVFEGKVDIESAKVDIRNKMLSFTGTLSEKTINHAMDIYCL